MHLAQLNFARLRAQPDHPSVAEFSDNVERINALAARSPGFVWRLTDEFKTPENKFSDDELQVYTLSVWENAAALENFVFKTVHVRFYKKRTEWFEKSQRPNMVLWPVEEGHRPTVAEAQDKLADYEKNGPSERAFGWAEVMDIERMRALRCA